MNYGNRKQQTTKRPMVTLKRVLVLFCGLILAATVAIFAYEETRQAGDYDFIKPYNDYIVNEEEPHDMNNDENSDAMESNSGNYDDAEDSYSGLPPSYMYDSDTGVPLEDMNITPFDDLYASDRDYGAYFDYYVEIGLLEVVEDGVILHDISTLEYFNTPESDGGYIGIQPLGDIVMPDDTWWDGLRVAINSAPVSPVAGTYNPTRYTITITVAEILTVSPDWYSRITIGGGRNVRLRSGPEAAEAGNENGNVRLVKNKASLHWEANRHFVVYNFARLELDGITLTRSDEMINGINPLNNKPYSSGGIVVRNGATLYLTGGTIIENIRKNANEGFGARPWFAPAAVFAEFYSYVYLRDTIIRNNIGEADTGGLGLRHGAIGYMYYPSQIIGNRALMDSGGGVSVASRETRNRPTYSDSYGSHGPRPTGHARYRDSEFHMFGGYIMHNFCNWDGGGVRVGIEATFTMHEGAVIAYNYSNRRGGGVEVVEDSTFRWYGGVIRDNGKNAAGQITTEVGGGISVVGGSVLEVPASSNEERRVRDNSSLRAGGGIYMSTAGAGWAIRGVTPSRISVPSTLIIPSGVPFYIYNNHTNGDGGGIYLLNEAFFRRDLNDYIIFGANVTMHSGQITNNTANQSGGGLSVSGVDSVANLTAGIIRGNTALNGGGASVINFAEFTLSQTARIYNNLATTTATNLEANGGGVFASTGSTFNLNTTAANAIFNNVARATGPTARANGGGFVVHGNILNMVEDSSFTGNHVRAYNGATVNGGGLAVLSGTFILHPNRTVSGNTAHADGPGSTALGGGVLLGGSNFTAASGSNITNNNAIAINGATARGGGVSVNGSAAPHHTLASGSVVTGNAATATGAGSVAQGGGVIATGGTLNVATGAIVNNNSVTATGDDSFAQGGGFAAIGGLIDLNINVVNNSATANGNGSRVEGGGVFVGGGQITITGSNITNNTATANGGDIYGVGLAMSGGTFTMSAPTVITANTSTITGTGNVFGGGVAMLEGAGGTGGTLNMNGGSIHNNSATQGGGVWMDGGTMNLSGGYIRENAAIPPVGGGGTHPANGGGVWMIGGTMNITGGSVRQNTATSGYGGGLLLTGEGALTATLNMNGGIIGHSDPDNGNTALRGAGVHISGGAQFNMNQGPAPDNTTGTIVGNSATAPAINVTINGIDKARNAGGGVHMVGATTVFTLNAGHITNNFGESGGGVGIVSGTFNMHGGTINQNRAVTGGGVRVLREGADAAVFNMHGGTISHNTLRNRTASPPFISSGGGINVDYGVVNIHGGVLEHNRGVYGGAVHVRYVGSVLNMHGGRIRNNISTQNGGGVRVVVGGLMTMHDGYIYGNQTPNNGGGVGVVSVRDGSATVISSEFRMYGGTIGGAAPAGAGPNPNANTAVHGAGVAVSNGSRFYMINYTPAGGGALVPGTGRVMGNVASGNGGGVWVSGTDAIFTMNSGTVGGAAPAGLPAGAANPYRNTAVCGGGVAVAASAHFIMDEGGTSPNYTSGTIAGNHATGSAGSLGGGGVLVDQTDSMFVMHQGTITGNLSTGLVNTSGGGGVRVRYGGHFIMHDGHIHNNTAPHGGGLRVRHMGVFTMNGGIIENNHVVGSPDSPETGALGVGGGVHVQAATFNMNGGIIRDHETFFGGGVRVIGSAVAPTFFYMHGGRIYGNSAVTNGGGVIVNNANGGQSTFTMTGGTIGGERPAGLAEGIPNPYANTAAYGGGVHVHSAARFYLSGTNPKNIIGNEAENSGGGVWMASNSPMTMLLNTSGLTITHNTAGYMGGGIFTERHEYACPITRYPGAAGVPPANVAYSNLTLTGVTFNHNQSYQRYVPPRNAWDVIAAAAFSQTSFPATPPPIRNHPLNNCDINFRSPGMTFSFHKTNDRIFGSHHFYDSAWVDAILLAGAQFSIYRYLGTGTPTSQPSAATLYPAGDWMYIDSAASSGLISTPISFQLFYGVYYQLIEHQAPSGFQAPFGQWLIRYDSASGFNTTVVHGTAPTIYYIPCDCGTSDCEGGSRFVGNMRDFELPLSGGMGYTHFIMGGTVILVIAFVTAGIIVTNKAKAKKAAV